MNFWEKKLLKNGKNSLLCMKQILNLNGLRQAKIGLSKINILVKIKKRS